jgi:hypothetical protein
MSGKTNKTWNFYGIFAFAKLEKAQIMEKGQISLPFYFGVDKVRFVVYNTHRNGGPALNRDVLTIRVCGPFLI